MANRVLLNSSGLKVSAPGFNVLTTEDEHLIFSSDTHQANVYMKGVLSVGSGTHFIPYGKTYSRKPLACFGYASVGGTEYKQFWGDYSVMGYIGGSTYSVIAWVRVDSTGITFWLRPGGGRTADLHYAVWDLDQ